MLRHIKDQFRNPQTHPEEQVSVESAQRLFAVAVSAIEQMCLAGYAAVGERAKLEGELPPPLVYDYIVGPAPPQLYALPDS